MFKASAMTDDSPSSAADMRQVPALQAACFSRARAIEIELYTGLLKIETVPSPQ
jgi:hypothetical protein